MSIRYATKDDISDITKIYEEILDSQDSGNASVGWIRGVYPTKETAERALDAKELFVYEGNGAIFAAAIINQKQVPEYKNADWEYKDVEDSKVLVLHTLVVSPSSKGRGVGTKFVRFYEDYARRMGCTHLRMDTNAVNIPARTLYKKLGYTEADIVDCNFNNIPGVKLVCLEKKL